MGTDGKELTSAVEDYLKAIYALETEGQRATTSALAERMQQLRDRARGTQLLAAEVVTAAEADDATTGGVLEVLRLLQWQRPDERKQFGFLSGTHELRLIDKSLGRL